MKKDKMRLTKGVVRQIQDHAAKLQKGKLKAVVFNPTNGVRFLPIKTSKKKGKKVDILLGDPPWSKKSNH